MKSVMRMRACIACLAFLIASSTSTAQINTPSPLLAIDRNRVTVVERIVTQWGGALSDANAGITAEQLREMLLAMRADQLLAASLAGSLEGLRNVVAAALVSESDVKASLLHGKALGDANQDVVYVPVTPCRLVETRGSFPAVYQTGGAFGAGEVRTYTVQGGNGVCLAQLPGSINPSAVQMQVYGIPTTAGSGDIEILPQGGTFGSTATLVYLGNNAFTSASTTAPVNVANKQISVQVRGGGAHVVLDVVGYFRAPAGGYVSSITAGTGLTGGTITSTGTIAADTAYLQRRVTGTCIAGSSIRAINADGSVVCDTLPSLPVCSLSASESTPYTGSTITLTATCTGNPTSYDWSGTGFVGLCTGPTCQASWNVAQSIAYGVSATNPSGTGGRAYTSVNWTQPPQVPVCTLSASSQWPQAGQSITLTATCSNSPTSYTWYNCTSTSSTCTTTSAAAGLVGYMVTATNATGTSPLATVDVTWSQNGGGVNSCGTNTAYVDIPWGSTTQYKTTNYGGFPQSKVFVFAIAVPPGTTAKPFDGFFAPADYQSPPSMRTLTLSENACDFVSAPESSGGTAPFIFFDVGAPMTAGKTYYFSLRNESCGTPSCDMAVTVQWPH